jgi:hypothetical protein
MEFSQKTHLITFSFMSLSEFDFLCCYDPHTNEENMVVAGMDCFVMVIWWLLVFCFLCVVVANGCCFGG